MDDKNKKEEIEELDIADEAIEFREKLEKCEREAEEYLNGWKRAKADFINYKKDEAERMEEILEFQVCDFAREFMLVLDSFDLAIDVLEKEDKDEKGVYMIRSQLEDILNKKGFERISSEVGEGFDPSVHEAIGEIESDLPVGTIAEENERGYKFKNRVIRPAKVKLAKDKN